MATVVDIPDRVRKRLLVNRRTHGGPYYRKTRSCWWGLTTKNQWGYGLLGFSQDGKQRMTTLHRAVYLAFHGPLSDMHLEIAHQCHNKACVNPAHLVAMSPSENVTQTVEAGHVRWHRPTHCPSGHPYEDCNTLVKRKNGREARACRYCAYLQGRKHAAGPPRWTSYEEYAAHREEWEARAWDR